jgi:hypothetical protein
MKKIVILLSFIWTADAGATHWLTYYVYVETEYVQGPWARTSLFTGRDYRYLAAKVHEDLFGTIRDELAIKMLGRLKEEKPELYDWDYNLLINGDTVCLEPVGPFTMNETLMNEVTATMTINSFAAVCFRWSGGRELFTLADLTLPYFDLVRPKAGGDATARPEGNGAANARQEAVGEATVTPEGNDESMVKGEPAPEIAGNNKSNPLIAWFLISVLFNLVLLLFLILKSRK